MLTKKTQAYKQNTIVSQITQNFVYLMLMPDRISDTHLLNILIYININSIMQ